ncbi:MAG TPA: phosphoribosylaminoimidazolesuccinocarboxamide synthase, partial [Candidatus Limnocylindrales bacterium]|nr:phosphoribosylaminoimidazolesuccinocarboxamide synthase [Candidatus Limnocylindrales bacterium]
MPRAESFLRSGKVRDLYDIDEDTLLLVASDRLSAFDVVLPTAIPDKGRVLTGLSRFWFAETTSIVPNHLRSTSPADLPPGSIVTESLDAASGLLTRDAIAPGGADLAGRIMICRRARVLPVEVIVRGYLAGSGWLDYHRTGTVSGVELPAGLRQSDRLPAPVFTPSTKAELGSHDQNISFDEMIDRLVPIVDDLEVAGALAERIRSIALALYGYGSAIVARAGIVLADTKFEFGLAASGELLLIDEVLTPDSSRFWDATTYEPGRAQASYDKQFVRDWLETQPWDKTAPGPELPAEIVAGTRA